MNVKKYLTTIAILATTYATPALAVSIPSTLPCPLGGTCRYSSGGFKYASTWTYGVCPSPLYKVHTGADLAAAAGASVYAVAAGRVALVYSAGSGWGSGILLESRDSLGATWTSQYLHVNPKVAAGTLVSKGQLIATVAAISTGNHLHFGLWGASASYPEAQRGALPRGTTTYGLGSGPTCNGDRPFSQAWINPAPRLGL